MGKQTDKSEAQVPNIISSGEHFGRLVDDLLDEFASDDCLVHEPKVELDENDPFNDTDLVIGYIESEFTRRVFSARMEIKRRMLLTFVNVSFAPEEEQETSLAMVRELSAKGDLLDSVFWGCVKSELDRWDVEHLGLLKGWKVTLSRGDDIHDQLRSFISGGTMGPEIRDDDMGDTF